MDGRPSDRGPSDDPAPTLGLGFLVALVGAALILVLGVGVGFRFGFGLVSLQVLFGL